MRDMDTILSSDGQRKEVDQILVKVYKIINNNNNNSINLGRIILSETGFETEIGTGSRTKM